MSQQVGNRYLRGAGFLSSDLAGEFDGNHSRPRFHVREAYVRGSEGMDDGLSAHVETEAALFSRPYEKVTRGLLQEGPGRGAYPRFAPRRPHALAPSAPSDERGAQPVWLSLASRAGTAESRRGFLTKGARAGSASLA